MTVELGKSFLAQVKDVSLFQSNLQELFQLQDQECSDLLVEMDGVHQSLKGKKRVSRKDARLETSAREPLPPVMPRVEDEVHRTLIEKMLQGSIESFGDKLSGKLLDLVRELKSVADHQRAEKIKEIHDTAEAEQVDLANLFLHDKVESNIEADGLQVEEKKVTSVKSILEKLKKLQGG